MLPVGLLNIGERGEIVEVRAAAVTCASDCRVEEMGLRIGKIVEMLSNGGGGPILLKVDETRIALARGMAMKIMVRREDS